MSDVIIIGGGLAGSSLGLLLAKNNIDVLILDRGDSPSYKLSETVYAIDKLASKLGLEHSAYEEALSYDMSVSIMSPKSRDRSLNIKYSGHEGDSSIYLNRPKFDHAILTAAINAGAQYNPGNQVNTIKLDSSAPSVIFKELGEYKRRSAKVIVDASGKSALLANQLDLMTNQRRTSNTLTLFSHYLHTDFHNQLSPTGLELISIEDGYIFIAPLGNKRFSVGLTTSHLVSSKDQIAYFNRAIDSAPWLREIINQSQQKLSILAANNIAFDVKNACDCNYVIIGEALGFQSPLGCNGVSQSIMTAELAHKLIQKQLSDTATDKDFKAYTSQVREIRKNYCTSSSIPTNNLMLNDPHIPQCIQNTLMNFTKPESMLDFTQTQLMEAVS